MDDESVYKLTGLVPEAWFDLIARVVPGAIILVASTQNTAVSNVTIGGFAIGVLIAYAIGMVFDLCSSVCFEWVFGACAKCCPNSFTDGAKMWQAIDTHSGNSHGLLVKIMAEGIMFRSLFAFAVLHLSLAIATMKIPALAAVVQQIPIQVLSPSVSVVLAVVSLCCWLKMGAIASSRLRNLPGSQA